MAEQPNDQQLAPSEQSFQQAIAQERAQQTAGQPVQDYQTEVTYTQEQPGINWRILLTIPIKILRELPNVFSKIVYFIQRMYK